MSRLLPLSGKTEKLGVFALLVVPLGLGVISGFNASVWGLTGGVLLLALPKLIDRDSLFYTLPSLLGAGILVYVAGFRIQFINLSFQDTYMYLPWLSLPLTLGWLLLIARSVEFLQRELTPKRWHVFLATLVVITLTFSLLVALQDEPALAFGFQLGIAIVLGVFVLGIVSPGKGAYSLLARQLGLLLGALAISGVVKSVTTFIFVAPVASLALPVTGRSLGLVARPNTRLRDSKIVSWLTHYTGSRPLGIVGCYLFLSYLGLSVAWYTLNQSVAPLCLLLSTVFLAPLLPLALQHLVDLVRGCRLRLSSLGPKTRIFRTEFSNLSLKESKDEILSMIFSRSETNYVATPDVTAVIKALSNPTLDRAFQTADLVTPDGYGLIWASRLVGLGLKERVAGIDLLHHLFSSDSDLDVYFLGAREEVVARAADKVESRYDNVTVVGRHHGYFDLQQDSRILRNVNQKSPDLLLVGMGVPRQENWILRNSSEIDASVIMGVGGSFDVLSGKLTRAPKWLQEVGLEWLYRILLEPERLWKARLIPYFMARVFWEKAKLGLKKEIL